MEIKKEKTPAAVVVRVSGDIDLHSSPELRSVLLELVKEKSKVIVMDLSKVAYMDSSGLATLIECLQGLRKYSGQMRLADVPPKVRDVFALAQLERLFRSYRSVQEALAG